jgi:peptide/nickel transport system substrate-binding protein
MTRARLRVAVALVLLTAAAAGCGKSASSSSSPPPPKSSSLVTLTPAPTGTFSGPVTWGLYREVGSLDPIIAFDYPENTVIATLCDTLLRQSPGGVVGPGLGTLSYTDPTTLVVKLNPAAKFWDGHPVTADDVVYSLDRQRNPKLGGYYGLVFSRVSSITATDPTTVTIKLSKPDYWLPGELASTPGFIVEKAYVEAKGKSFGTVTGGTMCSGPYKLKSWQTGNELAVAANPNYWDPALRPKVSEIDFKAASTDAAATAALKTGELLGDYPLNISTLDELKADPSLNVYLGSSFASDAFIVSNAQGPLGNVKVRQALSLAVDRQGFINAVYKGAAQLPRTLANPGTWGYGKSVFQQAWNALPEPRQNIPEAKKLIQEAGVKGQTITLGMSSQLNNINTEALAFQAAGEQLGLNVKLKSVSAQNYIDFFVDASARKGIDGFFTVNYPDYADPAGLYSTLVLPGGSQNYDNFNDPKITSLMEQARTTADQNQRATLIVQAQKLIMQELPWIPVADPDTILIMNKKITGAPATFSYMFAPWLGGLGAAK